MTHIGGVLDTELYHASSVQFRSVEDGVHALGKAHNYALYPFSQKFPKLLPFKQYKRVMII